MPPYKKTKENTKYNPIFGFSKKPTVATTAATAPWKPEPVFFAIPPAEPAPHKPANPCVYYNQQKYSSLMPFYYQKNELLGIYSAMEPIYNRLLSTPEISKKINHRFGRQAELAKEDTTRDILESIGGCMHPLHDDIARFYSHVRIYTKKEFASELTKGFHWTLKRLQQRPWVMMTERYNQTIDLLDNNIGASVAMFKSTEWIGNMFLQYCAKKKRYTNANPPEPQCRLGCRIDSLKLAFVDPALILDAYGVYVLFDDAAYSGQQKALVLTTMLQSILPRRRETTILLMIPYRTNMAIDRFRLALRSHQHATPGCTIVQETRTDEIIYELTQPTEDGGEHRAQIHVWTGGTLMDECQEIMEHKLHVGDRLPALTQWFSREGSGGATLTLFEHKVPDFLSLNAKFGNLFKEKMEDTYAYNPPYKVVLLEGSRMA